MKNVLIVSTATGEPYSRRIRNSINWLAENKYEPVNVQLSTVNNFGMFLERRGITPENTLIYCRAAYPSLRRWMGSLKEYEDVGFRVINKVNTLRLTSDKLESSLLFQEHLPDFHPKTWEITSKENALIAQFYENNIEGFGRKDYVLKPITSMEQGANVRVYKHYGNFIAGSLWHFVNLVNLIPTNRVIMQEFINYVALHRVIVINGKALPYTFVDRPEYHPNEWKVSVCLNKTTMRFNNNPDSHLLNLGIQCQQIVDGEINYIDIFETNDGYKIGEINTACNLHIHEMLAKNAGHKQWNIHYRVAKYLMSQLFGE